MQTHSTHPFANTPLIEPEFSAARGVHGVTPTVSIYDERVYLDDGNRYLNMNVYKRLGGSYFFSVYASYGEKLGDEEVIRTYTLNGIDDLHRAMHPDVESSHYNHMLSRATRASHYSYQEELFGDRVPRTVGEGRRLCAEFMATRNDLPSAEGFHSHNFTFNGFHGSLNLADTWRGETQQIAEVWRGFGEDRVHAGKDLSSVEPSTYLDLIYTMCQAIEGGDTSLYPDKSRLTDMLDRLDGMSSLNAPEIMDKCDEIDRKRDSLAPEAKRQRMLNSALYSLSSHQGEAIRLIQEDPRFSEEEIGPLIHSIEQQGAAANEIIERLASSIHDAIEPIDPDDTEV
jgi:hypothetical protein